MIAPELTAFLRDLAGAALFESWWSAIVAGVLVLGSWAAGLLTISSTSARPALRALAGFPIMLLMGGASGILLYLLGVPVRGGLGVVVLGAALCFVVGVRRRVFSLFGTRHELLLLGFLLFVGYALATFGWGEVTDGTVSAMSGAWGDGPLHTLMMEAFVRRPGGDLSMPAFVGEQLREPFGYDFVAAMLRSAGLTVGGALTLPAAGLLACLLGWAGKLAAQFTTSLRGSTSDRSNLRETTPPQRLLRSARRGLGSYTGQARNDDGGAFTAVVAGVLVITFGGLQWLVMAEATEAWSPARFFGVHAPVWDKAEDLGLIWANHLNTLASQKHLLLAAAFLLTLAAMLLARVNWRQWAPFPVSSGPGATSGHGSAPEGAESEERSAESDPRWESRTAILRQGGAQDWRHLLPFAIATGLLPLFHTHAFLAAGLLWLTALVMTRSRAVALLGALALVVALPTLLWQVGLASRTGFLAFRPGWMASGGLFGWFGFWAVNLGVFLPLVGIAVWRGRRRLRDETLLLGIPALLLFLAANVVQFQPYQWDNFKLFLLAWLLVLPLVAAEMSRWRFRGARVVGSILLGLMSLTTLSEIPTHVHFRATYPVYTSLARASARQLDAALPHDAVVLADTDTVHNHPLTLTGRTLVMGYGGWIWTRAYPLAERAALLAHIRAADPHDVCGRATRVGATHVIRRDAEGRFLVDAC